MLLFLYCFCLVHRLIQMMCFSCLYISASTHGGLGRSCLLYFWINLIHILQVINLKMLKMTTLGVSFYGTYQLWMLFLSEILSVNRKYLPLRAALYNAVIRSYLILISKALIILLMYSVQSLSNILVKSNEIALPSPFIFGLFIIFGPHWCGGLEAVLWFV